GRGVAAGSGPRQWMASDGSCRRQGEPGRRTRNHPPPRPDPINNPPSSAADQLLVTSNWRNLFSRSMVKAIPALSKMASRARYRTPMNSGPLTRETMVQNWSADGAISRRRTSTSSIFRAPQQRKLGKRQRRRHPAPPQEPAGGNGRLGRSHRSCQTISHSQVVMEPPTESFPRKEEKNACRSRIAYCADDGEGRA